LNKKKLFVLIGLSIVSVVVYYLLESVDPERNNQFNLSLSWIIISIIIVMFINILLNHCLNLVLPWKSFAGWRFILHLVLGTAVSLLMLNFSYQFIKNWFTEAPPELSQLILLNVYGAVVLLPIYSLFFGFKFLRAWRKSDLEAEVLQKENTRSQMMMLRNHLDPHFLFNNLNTLSSLIDKDPKLSKTYLDKFAEVYRSILRTEQTDLTTVSEEMEVIDSYIYLLKIRFSDAINVSIDINEKLIGKAIPPLSIQMLIENALKHNVASLKKPIYINIKSIGDDFIEVGNNLQIKFIDDNKTIGSGIDNIKKRYNFYTKKEVEVVQTENRFTVRIPLLEVESV